MRPPSRLLAAAGFAFALAAVSAAQGEAPAFQIPMTSPAATVRQQIAATTVEVTYNRPSARGREIFGGLVPYGEVWRTGADAATRISFSTPVEVEGAPVAAGDYELFTVPGEREWTVILQPARSQWGAYRYDPANDAARVAVAPQALASAVESFTIGFDDAGASAATLALAWERVRVPVRVEVDLRATVVPQLEAALAGEGRKPYFRAAMFYFENDLDIDRAAELMDQALEASPDHIGMLYRKALILEKKGDRPGAIAAAERSLAGAATSPEPLRGEYEKLNGELLARLRPAAP